MVTFEGKRGKRNGVGGVQLIGNVLFIKLGDAYLLTNSLHALYKYLTPTKKKKKNTGFGIRQNWTEIFIVALTSCVFSDKSRSALFIYKTRC